MREENRYLLKWAKIAMIPLIFFLIFGIWAAVTLGKTLPIFIGLGLLLGMSYSPLLENKISSKLEKILGIRLKKDKSYGQGSYTYEGLSWNLLMVLLILDIALYYPIAVEYNNLPSYIGLLFLTIYPPIVMILRRSTFNDKSIPSAQNLVYVGRNLVSGGPGYNPLYYLLFSFAIGGASTIWGFSMLNFPDNPLQEGLSMVIMGLIGQTLILFPDKFNRISPVDTRTRKGLYFMTGVTIAIIICLQILSDVLTSIYG